MPKPICNIGEYIDIHGTSEGFYKQWCGINKPLEVNKLYLRMDPILQEVFKITTICEETKTAIGVVVSDSVGGLSKGSVELFRQSSGEQAGWRYGDDRPAFRLTEQI